MSYTGREELLRIRYSPSLKGDKRDWANELTEAEGPRKKGGSCSAGAPWRGVPVGDRRFAKRRKLFSHGEFRISVMAVILAMDALLRHSSKHTPIMVLDGLFAELDSAVRDRLANYLGELPNQIFITSTGEIDWTHYGSFQAREIRAGSIV